MRYNCTIGFNVERDGARRFVSASHCSGDPFGATPDTFAIRHPADGNNIIGREYIDRTFTQAGCPYEGFPCRYSDAAMFTYNALDSLGAVAHPYAGTNTLIAGQRFLIVGTTTTYNSGEEIDKVGMSGGWQYGTIQEPCWHYFDYWTDPPGDLMCQLLTTITVPTGDSGGPVFFWHGETITLAGIIVGTVNQNGVFSRFDHISRELGVNGVLGRVH